jgi:hypothetical protein
VYALADQWLIAKLKEEIGTNMIDGTLSETANKWSRQKMPSEEFWTDVFTAIGQSYLLPSTAFLVKDKVLTFVASNCRLARVDACFRKQFHDLVADSPEFGTDMMLLLMTDKYSFLGDSQRSVICTKCNQGWIWPKKVNPMTNVYMYCPFCGDSGTGKRVYSGQGFVFSDGDWFLTAGSTG